MVLVATLGSTAKAVWVNPAEWDFYLETEGEDVSWDSLTNVRTDYPQYDYNWHTDYTELYVQGTWYSGDVDSGSGTASGLPFVISDEDVGEPGVFTAHVHIDVDAEGYGHISMTNVVLGAIELGGVLQEVEAFRCGGNVTVTAVPEPATVALLGLGSLVLIRRKRRT